MGRLIREMKSNLCDSPVITSQMETLAGMLAEVKGKKVYGYLKKPVKAQVDTIVDALARLPEVAECYEHWNQLRDELARYYKDTPREHKSLSQQQEFKAIPIRANFALVFAALHFGILGAFGLDGHIPAVILADQILESHIHTAGIALVLIAVKIIVDGNEPGVKQREHTLNEIASLNAVSSKSGKVFYDDTVDLIGPYHLNQLLDFGTLKVCAAIPVVDKFKNFCIGGLRHGRNKFVQRKVLVFNAHTRVCARQHTCRLSWPAAAGL